MKEQTIAQFVVEKNFTQLRYETHEIYVEISGLNLPKNAVVSIVVKSSDDEEDGK
jgi:hypothetical protein